MKFYASFQITAQNCLINRAISYGDGVFETMLICKHDIPLWAFHYQRLEASMIRLQIHPLVEHEIHHKIMSLIADDKLYIVKLVVFRDDVKRGYASASNDAKYFITVNPYQKAVVQDKLTISRVKLSRQKKLAGLKHLNRLEQVLAAQELTGGHYNDALMLDKDNIIIETISKNINLSIHSLISSKFLMNKLIKILLVQHVNIRNPCKNVLSSNLMLFLDIRINNSN